MFSVPHMIIIFVVVLIVFGPQKLPELARGLGKLMAEFRKASADFKGAFEQEMREMERQAAAAERKKQADSAAALAAAEPATPASPAHVDTAQATEDSSADTRTTETPVITPVAESVPRGTEEEPLAGDSGPAVHSEAAPSETAVASESAPNSTLLEPSHDLQRPT
jgi:sec-independent protein translocase protein TatB